MLDLDPLRWDDFVTNWRKDCPAITREHLSALRQQDHMAVYAMGRNQDSAQLADAVKLDGFVDDFAHDLNEWRDLPVVRFEDVPEGACIISCVHSQYAVRAKSKGALNPSIRFLTQSDLDRVSPHNWPRPSFVDEMRASMQNHAEEWVDLMSLMADDSSQQVLRDVLGYRLTGDPDFLTKYTFCPEKQYFDPLVELPEKPVFVDGGGYNGDTSEAFILRHPDYRKIYFFEPSQANIRNAYTRLGTDTRIEFHQKGLSSRSEVLMFDPGDGSSSAISASGTHEIQAVRIDDVVSSRVDMIKLDVEGWELESLKGAERLINTDKPLLAVGVYHTADQFWEVAKFLRSIDDTARFFLRHYTEGWAETVLYCCWDH